eukprot:TRINITY_DN4305_c0_g1_i2.p1 TRINITY_DN4305_c0_g1~~TRINITY_DN4305_c0_g1_i2.p1  ORF type:complete len:264 (+),score=83.90 TRINITY_DN4305_c0_g1_i2:528-1319(+)
MRRLLHAKALKNMKTQLHQILQVNTRRRSSRQMKKQQQKEKRKGWLKLKEAAEGEKEGLAVTGIHDTDEPGQREGQEAGLPGEQTSAHQSVQEGEDPAASDPEDEYEATFEQADEEEEEDEEGMAGSMQEEDAYENSLEKSYARDDEEAYEQEFEHKHESRTVSPDTREPSRDIPDVDTRATSHDVTDIDYPIPRHEEPITWKCGHCGYAINDEMQSVCKICSKVRGEDTKNEPAPPPPAMAKAKASSNAGYSEDFEDEEDWE